MASREDHKNLPQGLQLTALDESFRTDPYPVLKRLRENAPVHEDPAPRRLFVTRMDDVKTLLHDRQIHMDPRKAAPGTYSRDVIAGSAGFADPPDMLFLDDPDHHRLRSLVSAPFRPKRVESWRPAIRVVVDSVLDGIAEQEFDLISRFASPVPVIVIARMLGIEEEHHHRFKAWSDLVVQTGFNPSPTEQQMQQAGEAKKALDDFFHEQIERRSANLGDDLISDMIRSELEGESLTHEEMVDQCRLLLVAGNVTTTDLIGNGVKALLDHPQQMETLRRQPELIANAVEEILRFDSPVTNTSRVTDRRMVVRACPIEKGESLHLSLAAANRDPEAHPNPDTFDIQRDRIQHVAFGGGRHLCLGAHLARVEAQEAISGLLTRYPVLRHGDKGFTHHAIPAFRGMKEFWVKTVS
ncbi:MAG: cytochrome P450 [Halioglobus sp.]|jgi:cytochrome P450